ncbi:MAG: GNAT family N-acetyltransferase [Caldilineaceae bacterium]
MARPWRDFWAVVLAETGELIGHLYFAQKEPAQWMAWELGYIFHPAYHNHGYATESAAALIRHGFAHWGIHRVMALQHAKFCIVESA